MLKRLIPALMLAFALGLPGMAHAFCGFYVAKADASLFNNASKVVLSRNGNRIVVTMASDYQGEPRDFAMVIPVPEVLSREQINTTSNDLVDRVDQFSAPRLVEYHDPDPCAQRQNRWRGGIGTFFADDVTVSSMEETFDSIDLGVTVEAEYEVDEYDVQILSAEQSDGLITWLNQEGYKIPDGAEPVIRSYLKQDMKFFVAQVNLDRLEATTGPYLPPLQIAYESDRFMLPIRLGTVNAKGDQELFVFALTRGGRIETSNYRTKKLPTGMDIPIFVRNEFPAFYRSMFNRLVEQDNKRNVYLEYAWNLSVKCDPCVAGQLKPSELLELGAWWVADSREQALQMDRRGWQGDSYITRLHLRYDADSFPEDLKFIETGNTENWQARYVLRHPAEVSVNQCSEAKPYLTSLLPRFEREATTLASLTGWSVSDIRAKMEQNGQPASFPGLTPTRDPGTRWYDRMWDRDRQE
ncbi:MAG: DUF2330 domain-containing protein [Alphaproteobacteria bacterium]